MIKSIGRQSTVFLAVILFAVGCNVSTDSDIRTDSLPSDPLIARSFYSGFEQAGTTWIGISAVSDGKIYYVLSTTDLEHGARFYRFNPDTEETEFLFDLTEASGESDMNAILQGKSHAPFFEKDGKLYISTHVGVHGSIAEGEEAITHDGYEPYPGGHLLTYDLTTGDVEDLGIPVEGEGILTMTMDVDRGHIYGITWPRGHFFHYDVNTGDLINKGLVSENGEAGNRAGGSDFRVLGRAMFVDPADGTVYYTTAEGDIFSYSPYTETISRVEGVSLKLNYFGTYDYTQPGSMAYNWREIVWYPEEEVAYGVHGNSGYLFRFDPRKPGIELVDRIASNPSKKSGMYDQHPYGYLGFDLGPDGHTLYYLTGGPIYVDGQRVSRDNVEELGLKRRETENVHLVTYHIPTGTYRDHGPLFYDDGSRVTGSQSIAVAADGTVYTLADFEYNGKEISDLVQILPPAKIRK